MPFLRKPARNVVLWLFSALCRFIEGSLNNLRKEVLINADLDDAAIEDAVCNSIRLIRDSLILHIAAICSEGKRESQGEGSSRPDDGG